MKFNECAQPGPRILVTIWHGLLGTRTKRLHRTKQDSSGVLNTECEEKVVTGDRAAPNSRSHTFLGRTHHTGTRSDVRQSETKRTRMRRRMLVTPLCVFINEHIKRKLTTIYLDWAHVSE